MSNGIGLNGAASSSTPLNVTSACTACGKECQCKCDRCGDFYCSVKCQRKDWPSHRFICFPMPKLVKVGQDLDPANDIPNISDQPNHATRGKISPKPESSPKSANSDKISSQLPDGSCVNLIAFNTSNRCFVCSTNPSAVAERERILKEIDDVGKESSALTFKPRFNKNALAVRNGRWCRVRLLGQRGGKHFLVSYIDFGDKAIKSQTELRKTSQLIDNLPCDGQMVQLKDVTDYCSDQKLMDLLNQFTNKEYKIKYFKLDSAVANVELIKWGSSISLNSSIQELFKKYRNNNDLDDKSAVSVSSSIKEQQSTHMSKRKENYGNKKVDVCSDPSSNGTINKINKASEQSEKVKSQPTMQLKEKVDSSALVSAKPQTKKGTESPSPIQKPCLIPPFEIIPLNENDHGSQVLVMDNSFLEAGFVGCLLEKYCENLKAITEFLNKYDTGDQPYKPKANEYCLAKFENMWYRAKVDEMLSDDKFMVVYIDFTNERELSSDSIRPYPLALDFACCTTLCGLDGLPVDLSKELAEFLEENLTPFSVLQIDSIRMKDNVCYLKSNALLKKLRDSKLL